MVAIFRSAFKFQSAQPVISIFLFENERLNAMIIDYFISIQQYLDSSLTKYCPTYQEES